MRLTLFFILLSFAALAQNKSNSAKNAFYYEWIQTWAGGTYVIMVGNDCKKCIVSPDSGYIYIIDYRKHDTIASNFVKDLPKYNTKQGYNVLVNIRSNIKDFDYSNIKVSILPACDSLLRKGQRH